MQIDFLIKMAGQVEGIDDATIAAIEADLPKVQEIIDIAKSIRPQVLQMMALWQGISPDIQKALSEIKT